MIKTIKPFLALVIFSIWLAGCAPPPYPVDGQSSTFATGGEGSAFDTYDTYGAAQTGGDAYYGSAGATYGNDNYYNSGAAYAGGTNPSTADYYNDPQYGINVVGGPEASAKDSIIYFSYDSSHIDNRSEAVIREHARYLREHPQTMVVLEGHTDERGSREYNVGLGERRAYAVKDIFRSAGVDTNQMRVLSYGEERPASFGSTELDYAKNRRVVIIY